MDGTTRMRRWARDRWAFLCLALALVGGCDDESHDGTISRGPKDQPSSSAKAAAQARIRLIYGPGSPLSSARVAGLIKKRLGPLGIPKESIRIGGEQIHVDVPKTKVAAVKLALAEGRLELYLFDDRADPLGSKTADHAKRFAVKTQSVPTAAGARTFHYLVAPSSERGVLLAYLEEHSTGAKGLVGPVFADAGASQSLRSYYVQAGDSVRGEFVKRASARQDGEQAALDLELEGSGKTRVLWATKGRSRLVLLVDGLVLGTLLPAGKVKDGKLSFTLGYRGGAAATLTAATALAKKLDGIAFSHLVTFVKERPLDRPQQAGAGSPQ
jgi:hypothetical protein